MKTNISPAFFLFTCGFFQLFFSFIYGSKEIAEAIIGLLLVFKILSRSLLRPYEFTITSNHLCSFVYAISIIACVTYFFTLSGDFFVLSRD